MPSVAVAVILLSASNAVTTKTRIVLQEVATFSHMDIRGEDRLKIAHGSYVLSSFSALIQL
jgi:hypothetical protein